MKKTIVASLLLVIATVTFGQYSLTFCEKVEADGKPAQKSNSFMISKSGSALKFLVKADEKLNTEQMDFKIFYINENGAEEEISQLPQKVQPNWNYTWKEVVFFDAGNYRVKVYDSKGYYLTSANLSVKQL